MSLLDGENPVEQEFEVKRKRHTSAYGSRVTGHKTQSTSFSDFMKKQNNHAWQAGDAGSSVSKNQLVNKIADTIMNQSQTIDVDAQSRKSRELRMSKAKTPSSRQSTGNMRYNLLQKMMQGKTTEDR